MGKTLGLSMIVRNEADHIERFLKQFPEGTFDRIYIVDTGSTDGTPEKARALGAEVLEVGDKFQYKPTRAELKRMKEIDPKTPDDLTMFHFSNARNFAFEQLDTDYICWLDADDHIAGVEDIRPRFDITPSNIEVVYWPYIYDYDHQTGDVTARHWRERIIKNNGKLTWKGTIHETLIPKVQGDFAQGVQDGDIRVKHVIGPDDRERSMERNFWVLLHEYCRDGATTDPRTIYYLGGGLLHRGHSEEGIKMLLQHIEKSGWDEDRFRAWRMIADCYRKLGDPKTALVAELEAQAEMPARPESWFGIADLYLNGFGDPKKALQYMEVGFKKTEDMSESFGLVDPTKITTQPLAMAADAYWQIGKISEAMEVAQKLKKLSPNHDFVQKSVPVIERDYYDGQFVKNFKFVLSFLRATDNVKLPAAFSAVPAHLTFDLRINKLRSQFLPPKKWGEDEIAYICSGLEPWSPKNVETGIGGSEEAVIYLTRELAKLGWKVIVYNTCGDDAGDYDDVAYRDLSSLNTADEFNVVVAWRQPNLFKDLELKAKRKIVDMHDMVMEGMIDEDTNRTVDTFMVKSMYHSKVLEDNGADPMKLYVASNGINLEDFCIVRELGYTERHSLPTKLDNAPERHPKKAIYSSSPDRGLECLVRDIWPKVKAQVPEAELHVYYGWDNYDKFYSGSPEKMKWKLELIREMRKQGVVDHGRIGHRELAQEMLSAGVWAYPTEFTEINCITALKAQAAGLKPVTTHCYALEETVFVSEPVATDIYTSEVAQGDFVARLVDALKRPNPNVVPNQIKKYAWPEIAKAWNEALK